MKYTGIIRDGQASFTDSSLAAYLAANQIDPIQYYLVNNGLKWAKPDVNGAYTYTQPGTGTIVKYTLVSIAEGGAYTSEGFVGKTVGTDGTTSFKLIGNSEAEGKVLTVGAGDTVLAAFPYVRSKENGQSISTTVDANGVIKSEFVIDGTVSDNVLAQGANGAKVLLKGGVDASGITTTYDAVTGALKGALSISTDSEQRAKFGTDGKLLVPRYTVAAGSAQYMAVDQATGEITYTPATVAQQVTLTSAMIAAATGGTVAGWLADNAANPAYPEGTIVVVPSEAKSYVKADASNSTPWEQVLFPTLSDAAIRSKFSAVNGVAYDANTGVINGVVDPLTTGLSVGADGFAFDYQNVKVYDEAGIEGNKHWYQTTLHTLLTTIATYAKRPFDVTMEHFYMVKKDGSGNVIGSRKFMLDEDLEFSRTGGISNGSDFDETSLTPAF